MITEKDLQEAIAECEGQRNPNANTCIKLAAFYTIKQHMFGADPVYSYAGAGESLIETVRFSGDSEFARLVDGMETAQVLQIIDELMDALKVINPRLYAGVLRKMAE